MKTWLLKKWRWVKDLICGLGMLSVVIAVLIAIGVAVLWPLWAGLAALKFLFS